MEAVVTTSVDRRERVLHYGHQVLGWVRGNAPTVALGWHAAALYMAAALQRFARETGDTNGRRCANPECALRIPSLLEVEVECAVWPLQIQGRAEWSKAVYLRERVAPAVGGFCSCACWRLTEPDALPPFHPDNY